MTARTPLKVRIREVFSPNVYRSVSFSETLEESTYLQVMLKLLWKEVTVPLGWTVTWMLSCTRRLFPGPLPMIRKLFTKVNTDVPPALPWESDRVTPVP